MPFWTFWKIELESTFTFLLTLHSTNVLYPSTTLLFSYQKDKNAKSRNSETRRSSVCRLYSVKIGQPIMRNKKHIFKKLSSLFQINYLNC